MITFILILCLIVGIICWFGLGCLGFDYWWKKQFPEKMDAFTIKTMLFVSYMGPLNFLIGYFIHGKIHKNKT